MVPSMEVGLASMSKLQEPLRQALLQSFAPMARLATERRMAIAADFMTKGGYSERAA